MVCQYCSSFISGVTKALLFFNHIVVLWSRDSVVSISTGYRLDSRGVGVQVVVGSRIFSFPCRPPALGSTQPPVQWVPGGKWAGGHETDHLPRAFAEVKKM
jgi:hypothetical protein